MKRLRPAASRAVQIREARRSIEQPTRMRLVKRKRALVAVADQELPILTDDVVRTTLEKMRR